METKYKLDLIPSPVDPRDYTADAIYYKSVRLPKTLDYRKDLPPIRNQGSQGSCSAMTAAVLKEWHELKELGYNDYMSPQFIYNLRPNKPEEGMIPRDTMKILKNVGILPEKTYPYGSKKLINESLIKKASNFKIFGFSRIRSLYAAKTSLISDGPLYAGFPVYSETRAKFWKQKNRRDKFLGGHAVAIVGWTENSFIVRNSWGENWGDNGYTYYPFDEWGFHWEIWSTIDADSCMKKLEKILSS
jgi:hypothetical protein